jgi:hypothetical protein
MTPAGEIRPPWVRYDPHRSAEEPLWGDLPYPEAGTVPACMVDHRPSEARRAPGVSPLLAVTSATAAASPRGRATRAIPVFWS